MWCGGTGYSRKKQTSWKCAFVCGVACPRVLGERVGEGVCVCETKRECVSVRQRERE